MKSSLELNGALAALTEALDDRSVDLRGLLTGLLTAAGESVPSLVSIVLTGGTEGRPFALVVPLEAPHVRGRTSLSISLGAIGGSTIAGSETGSRLIMLAARSGAFADFVLELDPAEVELDTHLHIDGLDATSIERTLDDRVCIDRALGVLLARGATMEEAELHLARRAYQQDHAVADVARAIVAAASD